MPAVPTEASRGLENGSYYIKSVSTGYFVARGVIEDKSLRSKAILLRQQGGQDAIWTIIKNSDGTYNLVIRNTPAFQKEGKLFGLLGFEENPTELRWKITAVPHHGADQYIIESFDGQLGWLLGGIGESGNVAERTQISVGPLISTRSLPPQYPTNERFTIRKSQF
ncbi:Serine protease inhibitor [Drechslerella dactyloides]|uniref:Serine protease inhibitor n=1 Tax=Drechslerella dactyloides TaxID=74499 RepID=A0AAD6IQ17_DREDA|nr:Serine protease inhibitor [Drechslerella dactyloides]